jgi:hypothetical protein
MTITFALKYMAKPEVVNINLRVLISLAPTGKQMC